MFVSDNRSWMDAKGQGQATAMTSEWAQFRRLNPAAKLVCLDMQHNVQTPATGEDVLNIGGFSDAVYGAIESFATGKSGLNEWVRQIEAIDL